MVDIFESLGELGFTQTPKQDSIFQDRIKKNRSEKEAANAAAKYDISQYVVLKRRICSVCNQTFVDVVLRTRKCRYLKSDTDLRAHFSPYDPIYYDVVHCHFCGYTAMNSHFDQVSEKQAALLSERVKSQYRYKEYPLELKPPDVTELYQLALLCALIKKVKASERAMLCLRLGWIAREQEDDKREQRYLSLALEGFELAYQSEDFPMYGMEPITLCYLLGDLSRKMGRLDKAMQYAGRVLTSKDASERLKDRARDLKWLIKDTQHR